VLHPDNDTYQLIETADLTKEIGDLFEERRQNILCK